jgi:Ca-activated chloride channel homolog
MFKRKSLLSLIAPSLLISSAIFGSTGTARALEADRPVRLEAELGQKAAGRGQTIYLRIGLEGVTAAREGKRMPVNVGLVIDRSGSMRDKDNIGRARDAAMEALGRLGGDDIASVTVFNNNVDVLLPATRMTSQSEIRRSIEGLRADGGTALFAGTDRGIREVEKFLAQDQVNRVVLISDGHANVGPSDPREIAELGRRAAAKGISITTLGVGLGYNEDLMTQLAYASDGSHAFVENPDDLMKFFNREFSDVLSVAAQNIIIELHCRNGFKPMRMIGREGNISGDTVRVNIAQIYDKQKPYAIVELRVPDDAQLGDLAAADIQVRYDGGSGDAQGVLSTSLSMRVTDKGEEQTTSMNKAVMGDVAAQKSYMLQDEAIKLRDAGKIDEAQKLLGTFAEELDAQAAQSGITSAAPLAQTLRSNSAKLADESNWSRNRKLLKDEIVGGMKVTY